MTLFNEKISNFDNYKDLKEFVDNLHHPDLKADKVYKDKVSNKLINTFLI